MVLKESDTDDQNIENAKLYDRLLFDEDFQALRLEALKALPKDKQNLLNSNDKIYLNQKPVPKWVGKNISKAYENRLDAIDESRIGFFRRLKNIFSGLIIAHPVFSGGGFVTVGFLCGILLPLLINEPQPEFRGVISAQVEDKEIVGKFVEENHFWDDLMVLARQGNAEAQNKVGDSFKHGKGVVQDYQAAVKWYRLAAQQGNYIAQYNLAEMYLNGLGVATDKDEAREWFEKSQAIMNTQMKK